MTEQAASRLVSVTGATGFVGRHLVAELRRRGVHVRALVRDLDKASSVLGSDVAEGGIDLVKGDVNDAGVMDELVRGADCVMHLIGIRRELGAGVTYKALHVAATRSVVEAAQRQRVPRYVHMSALGTRGDAVSGYHRSKYEAEWIVRRSDLDWTILRPSLIHGPDGEFMEMASEWSRGEGLPIKGLPYFFRDEALPGRDDLSARVQPVHVDDVAIAFCDAMENNATIGEIYNIAGPDTLGWPELMVMIRDNVPRADRSLKPRGAPGVLASRAAQAAQAIGLGSALPFGPDEPLMAIEDNVCDLSKPASDFGFAPRPFEASLRAYASQL